MGKNQKAKFLATGVAFGLCLATSSFAVTSPDLPMAGWATQNGGTTGGAGKNVVTVSNVSDLRKYAEAGNATIYVKPGTYTVASKSAIKVGDNVTIYGYQGAVLAQTHTDTKNEDNTIMSVEGKNIIIRNLVFKGSGAVDKDAGDCLHVKGGTNVWIDHVEVYDGEDGNLDVINGANYVTISWTKFHYTSASTNHMFSNLIGNSDSKTTDDGKLKTTIHHSWWGKGVGERMPRVRFGEVHVANNLFDSDKSSTCVRAGKSANLRVENNVFIGVNNPIDLYEGDYSTIYSAGNYEESIKKGTAAVSNKGETFKTSYSMALTDVSSKEKAYALRDSIQNYSGATLPDPGASSTVTPVSSSSVQPASSSSEVKSSSSVASSSSQVVSGSASLTKHGSGSATQEVSQGAAIAEFYYTIEGATGATVTGLPDGVSGTLKGSDFYISGTVSATAVTGAYKFTVTTTGASTNASKSGTITVTGNGTAPASSSSAKSSSSVTPQSSDSETSVSSSSNKVTEPVEVQNVSSSSEASVAIRGTDFAPQFTVSTAGRVLQVQNAAGNTMAIFDMQGRLFLTKRIATSVESALLPHTGTFILKIGPSTMRVNAR